MLRTIYYSFLPLYAINSRCKFWSESYQNVKHHINWTKDVLIQSTQKSTDLLDKFWDISKQRKTSQSEAPIKVFIM